MSCGSNDEDGRSCEESYSAHDRPWRVNSSVFAISSMGGRASIGKTSAEEKRPPQFRFAVPGVESLERKRTRLNGRSATSWGRTAEELLSRWAALLIAARQHNSLGDL